MENGEKKTTTRRKKQKAHAEKRRRVGGHAQKGGGGGIFGGWVEARGGWEELPVGERGGAEGVVAVYSRQSDEGHWWGVCVVGRIRLT